MKRTKITLFTLAVLSIVFSAGIMDKSGKAGYTGSPGEATCNTSGCHSSFALNSGGGTIGATCTMINWKYEPMTTYSISIKIKKTGVHLFGFGAEVLTSAGANAGTINVTDGVHTQIKSKTVGGMSRRNITHVTNGGSSQDSVTFTFGWTSPDTTTGPITLYYVGNASNANGSESGDYIYTGSQVITPQTGLGVEQLTSTDPFTVFPNPASDKISLHYFLPKSENVEVKLYNINGSLAFILAKADHQAGENNESLSIPSDCKNGLYVLSIESVSGRICKKLMIN